MNTTTNGNGHRAIQHAVTATPSVPTAREVVHFDAAQRQIIRDMYARDSSDAEFATLMTVAEARGLDPRLSQCYFVKRWDNKLGRETWACQISIDGLRGQAESTGDYDGQDEPEYITDERGAIVGARIRVYRKSISRAFVGVAYFDEYVQTKKDGTPTQFWTKMRRTMLGKCAEALAIRKAFPHTAGLYTPEEMAQATVETDGAPQLPAHIEAAGDDPGYEAFVAAKQSLGTPLSRDQAVTLWRDHCATYAPSPRVRAENGERVQAEINAATVPPFQSTHAFRNAVVHAEYCDAHEPYAKIAADARECKAPEEIATAWMDLATELATLPAEVHAFALQCCGALVSRADPSIKQGTQWLKKRIAALGGTPPEKPTRGPNGRNATGDHSPSESADPEREAIQAEGSVATTNAAIEAGLVKAWAAGEVTPETWSAHLDTHENEIAVSNSYAKHLPKFGRVPSVYRGVAMDRLREIGLSDMAATTALDNALKARTAREAKAVAA